MGDSLLILAIGPVQDFIATARTSHDLEFGSWMLSELSKAAAKALFDQGAELIFPAPERAADLEPESALNVANKVVALVKGDSEPLAEEAERAVQARLWALAQDPLKQLPDEATRARARQQIENGLLEFYWASASLGASRPYKTARSLAEAALAARKRTRDFTAWPGVPGAAKSSLDGFREEVFVVQEEQPDAGAGEVLSGVDWVKRKGKRSGAYRSTSDFAAAPFRQGLGPLDPAILADLKALLQQHTDKTETDGAYYFVERLTRFIDAEESKQTFTQDYEAVFRRHRVRNRVEPYYALLVADGDSMGKAIDHQDTKEDHQRLSRALSEFASKARQIIQEADGQAVYTGGDDILAYLPLHTALDCVEKLDQTFSAELAGFAHEGSSPTLSGGLAIAHHLTPLSDVLDAARRAERTAKNHRPQKHALAIVVTRRSGGETLVAGGMEDMLPRLKRLATLARDGALSKGAAYELRDLADFLQGTGLEVDVFAKEAVRIISRKRESGGATMNEAAQKELGGWLKNAHVKVLDLANEMIVAQEFAKAQELAQPQKEVQP